MKYPDFGGEDSVKLGGLKTRSIFSGTEFSIYIFIKALELEVDNPYFFFRRL